MFFYGSSLRAFALLLKNLAKLALLCSAPITYISGFWQMLLGPILIAGQVRDHGNGKFSSTPLRLINCSLLGSKPEQFPLCFPNRKHSVFRKC